MQFIDTATSQNGSTIGHGLTSFTSDIKPVAMRGPGGQPLVFVDTPGFDDTHKSDTQILATIATWLISA
jgi:predicted GTPase